MSTSVGQSFVQPLQARQRSSASSTSAERQPSVTRLAVEHLVQQPRAAAGRVHLLARRDEARAHHVHAVGLAAAADADAADRRVADLAVILRVGEGDARPGRRARELEVGVERARVDDLARVHLPVGVPDPLELAERLHELVAEHAREQLGARLPVAVLARERAAVGDDEVGRLLDEAPVARDPAAGSRGRSRSGRACSPGRGGRSRRPRSRAGPRAPAGREGSRRSARAAPPSPPSPPSGPRPSGTRRSRARPRAPARAGGARRRPRRAGRRSRPGAAPRAGPRPGRAPRPRSRRRARPPSSPCRRGAGRAPRRSAAPRARTRPAGRRSPRRASGRCASTSATWSPAVATSS